jgi:hypothetical protein
MEKKRTSPVGELKVQALKKKKAVLARERNTGTVAAVSHDVKDCCQTYGYACRPYREMTTCPRVCVCERERERDSESE